MAKYMKYGLCLIMAAAMLLSCISLSKPVYGAELVTLADEGTGREESETSSGENAEPEGGGRKDIDLENPEQVFWWMETNLPGTLAEWESLSAEWWEALLLNERITVEGELRYRRFIGDNRREDDLESAPDEIQGYISMLENGALAEGMAYASEEKAVLQAVWESVGSGRVNRKYLNGRIAFCFNEDRRFPNGATYGYKTADEAKIDGRLAYIVQNYGESGVDNAQWWNQNQAAIWAVQAGAGTKEAAEAFARSYCHDWGITDPDTVKDYVQNVGNIVDSSGGKSGTAYLYQADNPANQDLATFSPVWEDGGGEEPPVIVQPEYGEVSASETRTAVRTHSVSIDSKYASVTGETLVGAVFEVYENGEKAGTITTDSSGQGSCSWDVEGTGSATVTKSYCSNYNDLAPELQATVSGYTSRDAAYGAAPEGFVLNGKEQVLVDLSTDTKNAYEIQENPASKTTFVIDNSAVYPDGQMGPDKNVSMDEYGRLIVTVEQENREQKGIVEITKYGEQLYVAEASGGRLSEKAGPEPFRFLSQTDIWDTADQIFDYRLAPIAGAVFHVYVAEDIYTQQIDRESLDFYAEDTGRYLVLRKGEQAGTITTDESGFGYLGGLSIGRYYIEEVQAGEGFVLNTRREEFEITAAKPEQSFIRYESSYINER